MKPFQSLFSLTLVCFASAAVLERAQCNADNCLRALRNNATYPNYPREFSVDCAFGVQYTATPCPTKTTLTFVQESGGSKPYTASITQHASTTKCPIVSTNIYVPYYATSACNEARYISACNCIGAAQGTFTSVPDAVVATTTTTVRPSPTACNQDFILVPLNRNVSNQFFSTDGEISAALSTEIMGATQFMIDPVYHTANVTFSPSNFFFQGDGVVLQAQSPGYGRVLHESAGTEETITPLICSVKPYGTLPNFGKFSCYNSQDAKQNTFQIRPGFFDPFEPYNNIYIGEGRVASDYYVLEFEAVPVCGSFGSLP